MQEFKSYLSRYVSQAQLGQFIVLIFNLKLVVLIMGTSSISATGIPNSRVTGVATWENCKSVGAALKLQDFFKLPFCRYLSGIFLCHLVGVN